MRSTVAEEVRAANCSGRGSSTVPLEYRYSHGSHRVRAADSRLLQRQTRLELTDRRSFTMLTLQITAVFFLPIVDHLM